METLSFLIQPLSLIVISLLTLPFYFLVLPVITNYFTYQYYVKQGLAVPSGFSMLTGSLNKLNEYIEDSQKE